MEPISITLTDAAVVVAGELDAETAPALAAALADADARDTLVVDLSGVEFIDSSGLRVLLETHHQRLADQRALILSKPSTVVERLLEVAGVSDYFTIEPG